MMVHPKMRDRILKLAADGYIVLAQSGWYRLTDKGMAVLLSCADSPVTVGALKKTSLEFERANQARQRDL